MKYLWLFLLLIPSQTMAITREQFMYSGYTSTVAYMTFPNPVKQGSLIIVRAGYEVPSFGDYIDVSDNQGNVYHEIIPNVSASTMSKRVFYAENANAGETTITIKAKAGGLGIIGKFGWAEEFSGIVTENTLDQHYVAHYSTLQLAQPLTISTPEAISTPNQLIYSFIDEQNLDERTGTLENKEFEWGYGDFATWWEQSNTTGIKSITYDMPLGKGAYYKNVALITFKAIPPVNHCTKIRGKCKIRGKVKIRS